MAGSKEEVTPIRHEYGTRIITTSGVGTQFEPRKFIDDYRANSDNSIAASTKVESFDCALRRQGQTATFFSKSADDIAIIGILKSADNSLRITSNMLGKKTATVHFAGGSKVEIDLDTSKISAFFQRHFQNKEVRPADALRTLGTSLDKAGVECKKDGEVVSNQDLVNDLGALRALLHPSTINELGKKAIGNQLVYR
jgi:hypothetical protein